jgi:hypothetical protein
MTRIFAERSAEKRREGEALTREPDNLSCQSWNEHMWSDAGPIDPCRQSIKPSTVACAALGYSDKLNVHSPRHTTATRLGTQKYVHLTMT